MTRNSENPFDEDGHDPSRPRKRLNNQGKRRRKPPARKKRKKRGDHVRPDLEAIDRLILNDPARRSRNQIFKDAGLCGGRLYSKWKNHGVLPTRTSLELLARELHGCDDVNDIINHGELPIPDLSPWETTENTYRNLVISMIQTPEFRQTVMSVGGFDKVDVREYVEERASKAVHRLELTYSQMVCELRQLCRMGWLRENATRPGDEPQFYYRLWYERQIQQSYRLRKVVEVEAVTYAYGLKADPENDRALAEYHDIVQQQKATLDEMKEATKRLREEPTNENAIAIVNLDCRYHQGWGGYDPTMIDMLAVGIGGHLQAIGYLIVAQCQLEAQGKPLPKEYVSLAALVDDFYDDLVENFQLFLAAHDEASFNALIKNVEEHPATGQQFVDDAKNIVRFGELPETDGHDHDESDSEWFAEDETEDEDDTDDLNA